MDENTQAQQQAPLDRSFSISSLERTALLSEEQAAMTIEFLRARLLSERSVSKAARQQAQQLAKKVLQLENLLDSEIQLRKNVETARLEVLSKYREELMTEHGNLFVPNFEEEYFDRTIGEQDFYADGASRSRSDDAEQWEQQGILSEGFSQPSRALEEKGIGIDNVGREISSRQLNFEEDGNEGSNNDDHETDQTGSDKGVLAWGGWRGAKMLQRGQHSDRFERKFSYKSFVTAFADESPQKRWAGKSVRQIRKKKEIRLQETNSGELSEQTCSTEREGIQQEVTKEDLQGDEERDAEVETALRRQAEFIEQFEAEENAQRAWEEKFREEKPLISPGSDQDLSLCKNHQEKKKVADITNEQNSKKGALVKEDVAKLGSTNDTLASQHAEDVARKHSRKVHPDDCPTEDKYVNKVVPSPSIHNTTVEASNMERQKFEPAIDANEVLIVSDACQADTSSSWTTNLPVLRETALDERQSGIAEDAEKGIKVIDTKNNCGDKGAISSLASRMELLGGTLSSLVESQYLTQASSEVPQAEASENQVNTLDDTNHVVEEPMRDSNSRHEGVEKLDLNNKQLTNSFIFSPTQNLDSLADDAASNSHQKLGHEEHVPVNVFPLNGGNGTSSIHATGDSAIKIVQSLSRVSADDAVSQSGQEDTQRKPSSGDMLSRAVPHGDSSIGRMKPHLVWEMGDGGQRAIKASEKAHPLLTSKSNRKGGGDGIYDPVSQVSKTASDQHGLDRSQAVISDKTNVSRTDRVIQIKAGSVVQELAVQQTRSGSHMGSTNGLVDGDSACRSSDKLMRDSPQEGVFRRTTEARQLKNLYGLPTYRDRRLDLSSELSANRTVIPDYSVPWGYGSGGHQYKDTALNNYGKSVDGGFNRVTEVLEGLQLAKHQIESSGEQATVLNALSALQLAKHQLQSSGEQATNLANQDAFRGLQLKNHQIQRFGEQPTNDALRALHLARHHIQSADEQAIGLAEVDALQALRLAKHHLQSSGEHVTNLSDLDALRALQITKHQIWSSRERASNLADLDVLRALQLAKHQIQISGEQARNLAAQDALRSLQLAKHQIHNSGEETKNLATGYYVRGSFYKEPPAPASYHAPHEFTVGATGTYSSLQVRGLKPFMPVQGGTGAAAAWHARSSSRQPSVVQHAPRGATPENLQANQYTQDSSMYHHDAWPPR